VLLQTLVQVEAEPRAEQGGGLLAVHLAERGAVHGAAGQAQAAGVELAALHDVADPLQDVVLRPAVRVDVPVPRACRRDTGGLWDEHGEDREAI